MVHPGPFRVIPSKGSGPHFGKLFIPFTLMELWRSNLTHRSPRARTQTLCNFFLGGGWEGACPNSIFSKFLELSKTSRARKLILWLQVNIDNDMTLPSRWYIGGPAKICNRHISTLHVHCESKKTYDIFCSFPNLCRFLIFFQRSISINNHALTM